MQGGRNQQDNSYKLDTSFKDSISDLQFAKQQRYLAATSWDGSINVWEFNEQYTTSQLKFKYPQQMLATPDVAFLRCCFDGEARFIFWSTSLGQIYQVPLDQPPSTNIQPIEKIEITFPVVGLKFCPEKNALIILQNCGNTFPNKAGVISIIVNQALKEIDLDAKPINMDLQGTTLVVAVLGPKIYKYDISSMMETTMKSNKTVMATKLEYQIRSIAISPVNPKIVIASSILGQIEILDSTASTSPTTIIPCHRNEKDGKIYTVNCVAPHPKFLGAITAGSDGNIAFINIEKARQGRSFNVCNVQLTSVAISNDGEVCAIAQGYDWSRGGKTFNDNKKDLETVVLYMKKLSRDMF